MAQTVDPDLAKRLEQLLRRRFPSAAAVRTTDQTRLTAVEADLAADFEIGSVSKGLTGMLYRVAVERGEVTPETRLDSLLPLTGSPVGAVTLGSLSTHSSGLPRLPAGSRPLAKTLEVLRHGTNPYGETLADLLAQAKETPLSKPRPRYSNLGFELLGHALAAAAGTSYPVLLDERILRPLKMRATYVAVSPHDLRPRALSGGGRTGAQRQPWTGEALGPAGGVRSTIGDLARLVRGLLDGTAPGASALDPVADFGRHRIGAGWVVLTSRGRTITWHNGGTGGFRSWVGLDREAGAGAVVLAARARQVDGAGFILLSEAVRGPAR